MQKITTEQLEKELQEIDKRIIITPNSNRPGASNVFLNGVDICPWVPSFEVQDEHSSSYVYHVNDMPIPFKTVSEVKEIVMMTLEKMKDKEYSDAMFNMPVDVVEETYGDHRA